MKIRNTAPIISAFVAGAAVGCAIAYAIFKKKMDKEIAKRAADIISTCEKIKKVTTASEGADGPTEDAPAERLTETETHLDDPDYDEFKDPAYDWIDEEEEREKEELSEEEELLIRKYSGSATVYNISEEEYDEGYHNFDKREIVFFDEDEPHCIDPDTGEDIEDWGELLGYSEGCLCDEMFEIYGNDTFIRNTISCTDYLVHRSSLEYIK